MKRNRLIFFSLLVASLLVVGCGDKDDKCSLSEGVDGEVLPDECYDCQWYASRTPDLSDTGFNTVTDLRDCYACHRETLKEDIGDTLRLTGWLYWGGTDNEWQPGYMAGNIGSIVYLTDSEEHLDGHHVFRVGLDSRMKEKFQTNFDELLGKKWYVTGILRGWDLHVGGCCSLEPMIEAFDFDTIFSLEP